MRVVAREEWPGTREELEQKVAEFAQAKEAHRFTEGVPAPLPEAPIIEELVLQPKTVLLQDEVPTAPTGDVPDAFVERQRAVEFAINAMIVAAADAKDAPDYLVNEAARIAARQVS